MEDGRTWAVKAGTLMLNFRLADVSNQDSKDTIVLQQCASPALQNAHLCALTCLRVQPPWSRENSWKSYPLVPREAMT
jgi:hypothetical protein